MHGAQKMVVPLNRLPHCKQFSNLAMVSLSMFYPVVAANTVPSPGCPTGKQALIRTISRERSLTSYLSI